MQVVDDLSARFGPAVPTGPWPDPPRQAVVVPIRSSAPEQLAGFLVAGFALRLVSSVALARTREALYNGWDKNDPKDAQVILHMLRIGATQIYADPLVTGINDIQELSKTHEIISKAKT